MLKAFLEKTKLLQQNKIFLEATKSLILLSYEPPPTNDPCLQANEKNILHNFLFMLYSKSLCPKRKFCLGQTIWGHTG